ncbi:MAG: gliding motility-associated C-terminal domain-containing protein, partial [Flavobacteriales bacterium]|nr:gliding motility-associated C-terminal domain-containing protein [Flavobacteriales bacterium]
CQSGTDISATITGTAGGFSFAPAGLSIDPTSGLIDVSASADGVYDVTYTTTGACPADSTISITITADDDASFTLTDFCVGSANTATGIATIGGTFSFDPDPADGATIDPISGSIIDGLAGTNYFIQYTTPGACSNDSTSSVFIDDTLFSGQSTSISFCLNGEIDSLFNYLGTNENGGFWEGPSTLGNGFLGSYNPNTDAAGVYNYILLSSNSCPNDTAFVTIDLLNPIADFSTSTTSGPSPLIVDFFNNSTNATDYFWDFSTNTSTNTNPQETFVSAGDFVIMLIASNGPCEDTAYSSITVFSDAEITVPNIFTPNGDGKNDLFLPTTLGIEQYELLIYNRWGQLIASIERTNQGWDGRNSAGEIVQAGTYYYVISAIGFDGKEFSEQGHFMLER